MRLSEKEIFTSIYDNNSWRSSETRSGLGSTLASTVKTREWISNILDNFSILINNFKCCVFF